MYPQYHIADAVYDVLARPPAEDPNAKWGLASVTPPKSYCHSFTWDPVKGKWQESPITMSRATLEQNKLNWPTEAPDIKIPAYAINVSYNARRDNPDDNHPERLAQKHLGNSQGDSLGNS